MFARLVAFFHPQHRPWSTRPAYRRELVTSGMLPIAISLIEGGTVGVLARKTFDASPMMLAAIVAAPMFANLTSFFWARVSRGRRKVPFITLLWTLLLVCITGIALLPVNAVGAVLLTLLVVVCRCILAGIITVRSAVWRNNYPRAVRAQVTGRLTMIASSVLSIAPLIGYAMLDLAPWAFRIIYPLSALLAAAGVWSFSKVRLRRERELLAYETRPGVSPQPHGESAAIYEYHPLPESETRPNFWDVLKRDRLFRWYMTLQFVMGMGVMSSEAVLIYYVAQLTEGWRLEYQASVLVTAVLPFLLATVTMPLWAKLMDRMHIIKFRTRHTWMWVIALVVVWAGAVWGSLLVIAIGRVIQGLGRGGGVLAWQLGHNDFADRNMVSIYMGIHQTLTGIRGAIFPFAGMALATGWEPISLGGVLTVGGFEGLGPHFFLVSIALCLISSIGYVLLYQTLDSDQPVHD